MTEATRFDAILGWLRAGYPDGVPPKDYFPLLALLARSLDEEQITQAVLTLAKEHGVSPVTENQIHDAIAEVIKTEPNADEINQVAGRLAAVGWPLAPSPNSVDAGV